MKLDIFFKDAVSIGETYLHRANKKTAISKQEAIECGAVPGRLCNEIRREKLIVKAVGVGWKRVESRGKKGALHIKKLKEKNIIKNKGKGLEGEKKTLYNLNLIDNCKKCRLEKFILLRVGNNSHYSSKALKKLHYFKVQIIQTSCDISFHPKKKKQILCLQI